MRDGIKIELPAISRRDFGRLGLAAFLALAGCGGQRKQDTDPEANLQIGEIHDQPGDVRGILGFGQDEDFAQTMDPAGDYQNASGRTVFVYVRRPSAPSQENVDITVSDPQSSAALGIAGSQPSMLSLDGMHVSMNCYNDAEILTDQNGSIATRSMPVYELNGTIRSLQNTRVYDPGNDRLRALSRLGAGAQTGHWAVGIRFIPNLDRTATTIHHNESVVITHVLGQPGNEEIDTQYAARLTELAAPYNVQLPAIA